MRISGIQDYISIFERVFSALGIQTKPEALLRSIYGNGTIATLEDPDNVYELIDGMFATRNHLVHEVDIAVVGSYLTRDLWTLSEARRVGEATLGCVKLMEAEITNHAPPNFPNRLHSSGQPESELVRIIEAKPALIGTFKKTRRFKLRGKLVHEPVERNDATHYPEHKFGDRRCAPIDLKTVKLMRVPTSTQITWRFAKSTKDQAKITRHSRRDEGSPLEPRGRRRLR
jgi:hypothetical protein